MAGFDGRDDTLQRATDFFRDTLNFVEQDLSLDLRRRAPDALLNVALARLVAREGRAGAATVLAGLAEALTSGNDVPGMNRARRDPAGHGNPPGAAPGADNTVVLMRQDLP